MGEAQGALFEPESNCSIKVQTFSQKLTSHAGVVLLREADHQLGLKRIASRSDPGPSQSREDS